GISAPVAVPLIDHVVMLGVEPAADFGMTAECVDRAVVVPAPVHVARAALVAPDIAELGVAPRLMALPPRRLEIPRRARERAVAQALDVVFPAPAGEVVVPGVEIGCRVTAAAADRVVFHESRGIEPLRNAIVLGHSPLRLRQVALAPILTGSRNPLSPLSRARAISSRSALSVGNV